MSGFKARRMLCFTQSTRVEVGILHLMVERISVSPDIFFVRREIRIQRQYSGSSLMDITIKEEELSSNAEFLVVMLTYSNSESISGEIFG